MKFKTAVYSEVHFRDGAVRILFDGDDPDHWLAVVSGWVNGRFEVL